MRRLLSILAFFLAAPALADHPGWRGTVANLPTCNNSMNGRIVTVTDGANGQDCSTGGGSSVSLCQCESGTGWVTVRDGAGSGSPGGSNTQVQFNDSTAFGGDAGLVYNKTTDTLSAGAGFDAIGAADLDIGSADVLHVEVITDGTGSGEVILPNGAIESAEILNDTITATDLAATITMASGDLFDFSATAPTLGEGLILPSSGECSSISTEGLVCWETDIDALWIGDGAASIVLVDNASLNADNRIISGEWDFGGGGIEIENNTAVPGSCTVGQIFMDTDATSGQQLYGCEGGTFVLQGDGGAGGGDSVSVDGVAATDPNFASDGDVDAIRCTGVGAPDASCAAAEDVIYRHQADSVDLAALDDGGNTPLLDYVVVVDTGANSVKYIQALTDAQVNDNITASLYVPLAGGTMTGDLVMDDGAGDSPKVSFDNATEADTFDLWVDDSEDTFRLEANTASDYDFLIDNIGAGNLRAIVGSTEDYLAGGPLLVLRGEDPVSANVCEIGWGVGSQLGELGLWQTDASGGVGSGDCDPSDQFISWKFTEDGRLNSGDAEGPWLWGTGRDSETEPSMGPNNAVTSIGFGAIAERLVVYNTGPSERFSWNINQLGASGLTMRWGRATADPTSAAPTNTIEIWASELAGAGNTQVRYTDDAGADYKLLSDIGDFTVSGDYIFSGALTVPDNSIALGTKTTGNYVASVTNGDGISGGDGGSEGGALTVAVDVIDDGDAQSATASSESGLEFVSGELGLIRGCSNGEVLKWDETNGDWDCSADSTGGSPTFDAIATGTNTTATMTVGTGASIAASGSGSIAATTAAALAANGGNCGAGEIPLGVDAAGAAEGCYEPAVADVSDLDNDAATLSLPANTTVSVFGATVVDDADAATARTTLGVDVAGTDNSTDVTLAGTPDYITIAGQVITRGLVVLTTDVSGILPVANGGTGASTLTEGGILLGSGSGAVTALGVATNGQIPIGDGTTDPVLATISGTANEVDVTNGAGSIQVGIVASPTLDGTNFTGIPSSAITTEVRSWTFNAGFMTADGTQCADPTEVTIGSWGKKWSAICTDNSASTLTVSFPSPDDWDAGTVTLRLHVIQDAADTSALQGDVSGRCVGDTETPAAYGTEVAMDDTMTGSDALNHVTSAAITLAGTCSAGDFIQLQYQVDATGTTTEMTTLNFVGGVIEYTSNVGS